MRSLHQLCVLALPVVGLALTPAANAQDAGAKKLFFEGDMVRSGQPNQAGPFCVLANQFKRKEAVAWRIRVLDQTGAQMDDKGLKSVVVELSELPASDGSGEEDLLKKLQAAGSAKVNSHDRVIELAEVLLKELPSYGTLILGYLTLRDTKKTEAGAATSGKVKADPRHFRVEVAQYKAEGPLVTEEDRARFVEIATSLSQRRRSKALNVKRR